MRKLPRWLATNKRYQRLFVVIIIFSMILFLWDNWITVEIQNNLHSFVSTNDSKTMLPGKYKRMKPKILLWTTFFGKMKWYEENKNIFSDFCHLDCTLTINRSELETSDAIVFHLHDITWDGHVLNIFGYPFPTYRRPDQVWVLHNLEPITIVLGSYSAWQGLFNWTWSYSRGSDIFSPYGEMSRLTAEEIAELNSPEKVTSALNYDYFGDKNKSHGVTMISNCDDEARRYRVIEKIRKYIDIDVYGRCGEPCPGDYGSCLDVLKPYQFYFALENSDCRDYVSEKYWRVLSSGQIPVVAWKFSMDGLVIPNSYINVYDFRDLDTAGAYIKRVSENRTLYNSYFSWKRTHKIDYHNPYCSICEKLKDTSFPSQVYHDMFGWLTNTFCPQATIFRRLHRIFDRFMFDGRLP